MAKWNRLSLRDRIVTEIAGAVMQLASRPTKERLKETIRRGLIYRIPISEAVRDEDGNG